MRRERARSALAVDRVRAEKIERERTRSTVMTVITPTPTGEEMTLSCPLPEEFENALKKLQRTMGL